MPLPLVDGFAVDICGLSVKGAGVGGGLGGVEHLQRQWSC